MQSDRDLLKQALEALEYPGPSWPDARQSIAAALRERLAQPEQEPVGWQSIDTAPKTGKKVILFYLNQNKLPRRVMARWLTDEQAAEKDWDEVGLEGGWYECIDNWDDYSEVAIHEGEPSHWMPLPADPHTTPPANTIANSEATPEQISEQEQEPVAWVTGWHDGHCVIRAANPAAILPIGIALYTTPPRREWVGLTEEDFSAINQSCLTKLQAATSAESILKEKNA